MSSLWIVTDFDELVDLSTCLKIGLHTVAKGEEHLRVRATNSAAMWIYLWEKPMMPLRLSIS